MLRHRTHAGERRSPHVRGMLLLATVTLILAGACSVQESSQRVFEFGPQEGLHFLKARFLSEQSAWLVPGRFWSADAENGLWSFRASATLWCQVVTTPESGMTVVFTRSRETLEHHYLVQWDGEEILQWPRHPEGPDDRVHLPPELLTPGLHALSLRRGPQEDDSEALLPKENVFRTMAYEVAGVEYPVLPEDEERLRYLSSFFSRGVAGVAKTKASGCLVHGPQQVSFGLSTASEASMSFQVENVSGEEATFSVLVDGQEQQQTVSSGERSEMSLTVEEGQHRVHLRVSGDPDGLFLWGAATFFTRGRDLPGPVVLVSLDTTRRDVLSPYGGRPTTTPNIQEFADTATTFDRAYSASPWTLPSHASIFTGLYPTRHAAGVSRDHLPSKATTLAEILSERGYFSAGFAGGEMCAARWGVAQGFDLYEDPKGFETRGDLLTDAARDLLERRHDRPLFLFVNYFDPHAVYRAPEAFEERFNVPLLRQRLEEGSDLDELAKGHIGAWSRITRGETEVSADGLAYLRAAYEAEVAFMDHQIGRLFSALKSHDLFDSALIILVADHGEFLGERGFFSHAARLDPELVEIPMIIKWPGQTEPSRIDELVSQVDLFPTVLEVADCRAPASDGLALVPGRMLQFRDRDVIFMEEHESRVHPLPANLKIAARLFGLQRLDLREVVWPGGVECGRRTSLGWQPMGCSVSWQERMDQLAVLARLGVDAGEKIDAETLSEQDKERLRALGYMD